MQCNTQHHMNCMLQQAALGLLQRLVHDGRESDGSPTRDRLKLIPRVVNVDEWAKNAPLSGTVSLFTSKYSFKTPKAAILHRQPRHRQPGHAGQERPIVLHSALVGYPAAPPPSSEIVQLVALMGKERT